MDIEPRFPALRLLIRVLQWAAYIFACVVVVFPVVSMLWLDKPHILINQEFWRPLSTTQTIWHRVVITTGPGLLVALGLYVFAQLVLVFLAIEANTRTIAEMLQQRWQPGRKSSSQN